ncbi:MAG TPA: aspartate aminotransferase family protein [Vicinamibacterales bacterium]|jgi:4-aminobutyrate aminotransferase-like enzyme
MVSGTQVWSRARTKALFDEEQAFIAPGLQTIALLSELAIERGRGSTLTDLDGNTYLDLNAGVSVASLGHAHPRYVAAVTAQLEAVSVGSFTSRPRAALVQLIAAMTPGRLDRVQFFSGGAEAVEAAIKLARSHTKRTDIIAFTGGFHGKTAGVLPISDVAWKHAVGPLPSGYHLATFPDPTRFNGTPEDCLASALASLRQVIDEQAHGAPAAIIVEPVQGTAGNVVPPDGFLREVRALASRCGALLVADEMITGFGRTGLMFGCDYDGVTPDIMTVGKGMASGFPVSAVISTSAIVAAEPFSLPSASSSSYGGNPLACAAALATIATIRDDRLVDSAARVGRLLLDGLRQLEAGHPSIRNVRGRGLLIGFDLVEPTAVDGDSRAPFLAKDRCVAFFKECLANGVILMGYTPRVRIHPPLILTADEALQAVRVIDTALTCVESRG